MSKPSHVPWLSPYIIVNDADAAIDFYKKAFGVEVKDAAPDEDGKTVHAELTYQGQLFMIGKQGAYKGKTLSPVNSGVDSPISLYVYCDDVDKFYQHAIANGALGLSAPEDTFWGDRMCRLADIDNYVWCFATHKNA